MANIAEALGQPLMPWQRQVVDVGLEILPNGLPAYRDIGVTIPRQMGKSTMVLAVQLHRALLWTKKAQKIIYSAQSGLDARKKLLEDQYEGLIAESPLDQLVRHVYRSMGAEAIHFKTGSRISTLASKPTSGHGKTVDLGIIDEAFADVDNRREQSLKPAMVTKRDAQVWVMSTAGDADSVYLKQIVARGRSCVADGVTQGIAYFEWSAEEGDDPADEATWWKCMPALGHTIHIDTIRGEYLAMRDESLGEFCRAYLNMWTVTDERVIPPAVWAAVTDPGVDVDRDQEGLVFGVDISPDRAWASIVAVDANMNAELVDHRPYPRDNDGREWLRDRVIELCANWGANLASVAIDSRGPAATLIPELKAASVAVEEFGSAEMAAACGDIYDAIANAAIKIKSPSDIDAAVAGAARRKAGDLWYWGRKESRTDVSPLVALTLAHALAKSRGQTVEPWAMWG